MLPLALHAASPGLIIIIIIIIIISTFIKRHVYLQKAAEVLVSVVRRFGDSC